MNRLISLLSIFLFLAAGLFAQPRSTSDAKTPTIAEKVASMEKFPGYFPFYWDARAGKIWLEFDKWNTEFLYVESLPSVLVALGPLKKGDLVLFSLNPFWRGQTSGSYFLIFNAILSWNNLNAGRKLNEK